MSDSADDMAVLFTALREFAFRIYPEPWRFDAGSQAWVFSPVGLRIPNSNELDEAMVRRIADGDCDTYALLALVRIAVTASNPYHLSAQAIDFTWRRMAGTQPGTASVESATTGMIVQDLPEAAVEWLLDTAARSYIEDLGVAEWLHMPGVV